MYKLCISLALFPVFYHANAQKEQPKVFVFTDIHIGSGDPDDRQSLVHLLWYADELEIMGIVPDRWNTQGLEACQMAIEAYRADFTELGLKQRGYPSPGKITGLLAKNAADAADRLKAATENLNGHPLYVLVWGNMINFGKALNKYPEIGNEIRLITIGTGLKYGPEDEVPGEDCNTPNWNGPGRNEVYNDPRFSDMWWLEINWTYNGMFSGEGPKMMFEKLAEYGEMGKHLKFVTKDHLWAQYFRVGDTPSVLYLIDPGHDPEDPTQSSWAGKYKSHFRNFVLTITQTIMEKSNGITQTLVRLGITLRPCTHTTNQPWKKKERECTRDCSKN
ncbi:nucleoside hydrolase-like domain-containing protein [Negadavirga shengliensis]|uniref:Nucleoside hydrolase-like domain-containing protein n=1 Tax=Negadavirga shengliensis TaxID=1389218 RepID=A0ABV9T5F4_9BACT